MKLIQSNIWGGKLKFQITDYLEIEQPDILCMQEVNDLKGEEGYLFATLDEIAKAGNFSATKMAPFYSQNYMNRTMDYGNAMASRINFKDYSATFTDGSFIEFYDNMEHGTHPHNFQHASFDINDTVMHVINYHGAYVHGSKAGSAATERHMQQIANYVKQLRGPVIVTGDFNATPDSKTIAILNAVLRNLCAEHKLQNTYSELSHHNVVCDYIFVSDDINVQSFEMADALISDHKALVLEFNV